MMQQRISSQWESALTAWLDISPQVWRELAEQRLSEPCSRQVLGAPNVSLPD